MRAMVLSAPGKPLQMEERDDPVPGNGEILVRIGARGVCRTDLHVIDSELPDVRYRWPCAQFAKAAGLYGRRDDCCPLRI